MAAPTVCTVILNWNDAEATLACLDSLAADPYPAQRIVVVDNASADGSADLLARRPGIALVRNPVNLGFTGGVNVGIRHAMAAGADYIWLLNSDAVVQPGVLSRLVAVAEADPRIGLVSPVFHDPAHPAQPEFCLGLFDPASRCAAQTADPRQAAAWQAQHPDRVLLLGTALLIRRSLVETIGPLDDRFFAYVEDVDYSLRSLAAGFRNVAVPDAIVYHKFKQPLTDPAACPPYLHYFMSRNYPLLWRKLPGPVIWRKAALWHLRQRLQQIQRMPDSHAAIDAVLAGLWDGFRGVGGPYRPGHRMPWPLRSLLLRWRGLWLALLGR